MKRLVLCLAAAAVFCAPRAFAAADARGVMIMNLKSESVLYIQNENKRVPPASLAKIMTMYVTMDALEAGKVSLADSVRISARAAATGGASMGLEAGERVGLDELIKGVAAASGNDAAVAVAEYIAGSEAKFVAMMNAKAKKLGLRNTRFTNPHGLPPSGGQWTTARDMLYLTKSYIETHPDALPYHSILSVTHGETTTTNKNKLLTLCPGVDGMKTGWIQASGYSLVSTAKRGDIRILCALLGASKSQAMTDESHFLLEAAFKTVESGGVNKVKYQLAEREAIEKTAPKAAPENAGGGKGKKG
jgi:D-alanyl-D-alanine carboxypeptidase (penicillin-binding protein 5/6)